MPIPRLENWSIVTRTQSLYDAPELGCPALQGQIYDHPAHDDGKFVVTSELISFKGKLAQTRNTSYVLGNPSEDFCRWLEENDYQMSDYLDKRGLN